ncbi:MAG: Bro-N domain-containing protein [Candidatus Taylorbacteria bacterium]|nr:Bro-N domain-containing protein [Candidatus Taylorbacteria bacterium]
MKEKTDTNRGVALFEQAEIRRTWHNERWYFVVEDVVTVLTDSQNVKDYITKMRERDNELSKGYGQFVSTLSISTRGGPQKMNCADLAGILRIIQSIPSPKAEPFKLWLARVGKERIDEIQDPELAVNRAKEIYERKGYPKSWIDKRLRGINIRNTLTDEWKERGVKASNEFAILTDEIYKGAFEMTAKEYKDFKSLDRENNLRDHMVDMELILTMLGEATTTELTKVRDSKGLPKLKTAASDGGAVAGRTRKDIEKQTKKKVVSKDNFLDLPPLPPPKPLDVNPRTHYYDDK